MPQADRHRSVGDCFRRIFYVLGPGLISGAADDDPSYSVVGAQFGTSILWTAFISWPLMAAIQMMCARIGLVTGRGLSYVDTKPGRTSKRKSHYDFTLCRSGSSGAGSGAWALRQRR